MTKFRNVTVAVLIAAALASGGCSVFKKGARPKTPVLGQRIDVLTNEVEVAADPATKALPFSLPAPVVNNAWTESGGNATNSMGHLALGNALRPAFSVQAGRGSSLTARLAAPPIVANGRVYTIDTLGASAPSTPAPERRSGPARRPTNAATKRRSTAAGSPMTTAASSPPTASAMSPRSPSRMAESSGRFVPAVRCAAPRRWPMARST